MTAIIIIVIFYWAARETVRAVAKSTELSKLIKNTQMRTHATNRKPVPVLTNRYRFVRIERERYFERRKRFRRWDVSRRVLAVFERDFGVFSSADMTADLGFFRASSGSLVLFPPHLPSSPTSPQTVHETRNVFARRSQSHRLPGGGGTHTHACNRTDTVRAGITAANISRVCIKKKK